MTGVTQALLKLTVDPIFPVQVSQRESCKGIPFLVFPFGVPFTTDMIGWVVEELDLTSIETVNIFKLLVNLL